MANFEDWSIINPFSEEPWKGDEPLALFKLICSSIDRPTMLYNIDLLSTIKVKGKLYFSTEQIKKMRESVMG